MMRGTIFQHRTVSSVVDDSRTVNAQALEPSMTVPDVSECSVATPGWDTEMKRARPHKTEKGQCPAGARKDPFLESFLEVLSSVQLLHIGDAGNQLISICNTGKLLRPILIKMLVECVRGDACLTDKGMVRDAASAELLHTSTLIHDDIIDESSFRRGQSTVNAERGTAVAILIGNIVKDHALSLASEPARKLLNAASMDVNLGQLWETQARSRKTIEISEYFAISLFKAGKMFRCCGEIASLHGAERPTENHLLALELVAVAYQAFDDYLDFARGSAFTGKQGGRDAENCVHSFMHARLPKVGKLALPNLPHSEAACIATSLLLECLQEDIGQHRLDEYPPDISKAVLLTFCEAVLKKAIGLSGDNVGVRRIVEKYVTNMTEALSSKL